MVKYITFLFTSLVILAFVIGFPIAAATPEENLAPVDIQAGVLNDVINSFRIYSSFFKDDLCLPVHATNRQEAINYLTNGWSEELAVSIVDTYTYWDTNLKRLVILPSDGMPILSADDISKITCHKTGSDSILLKRFYENCYYPGDLYLYQVSAGYTGEKWIIIRLELEAGTLEDKTFKLS